MLGRRKRKSVAPDQDAVVDRALCASALVMLGAITAALEQGEMDDAKAGEYLTETHRWLIREKLADALSGRERALIAKALTDWSEQEKEDTRRRNESVGVLLWALSAVDDLPPHDTAFASLASRVPLLAPTAGFRREASLRPAEEIASARALAAESAPAPETGRERQYALNWLSGYAADWDRVPTDS